MENPNWTCSTNTRHQCGCMSIFISTQEELIVSSSLSPQHNVMVFIAELFWWFETVKPDFVQPRDLQECKDGNFVFPWGGNPRQQWRTRMADLMLTNDIITVSFLLHHCCRKLLWLAEASPTSTCGVTTPRLDYVNSQVAPVLISSFLFVVLNVDSM